MRNYDLKNVKIELHNVVFSTTTPEDYEMDRLLLLENMPQTKWDEYVLVEGGHCSCYGFNETQWDATVFSEAEMDKLMEQEQYDRTRKELREFWNKYRNNN